MAARAAVALLAQASGRAAEAAVMLRMALKGERPARHIITAEAAAVADGAVQHPQTPIQIQKREDLAAEALLVMAYMAHKAGRAPRRKRATERQAKRAYA